MRWLALLLLLCPWSGEAQKRPARKAAPVKPAAPATVAFPIEKIDIEGNVERSREQILAASGLRVGQKVTPKDIDAARQKLLATGAFESLGFKYGPSAGGKGYVVTFQVVEAGPLFPVRFEELPAREEELLAALKQSDPLFERKIPATEPMLTRYTGVLQAYLAGRNYREAIVGKLLPDDAGQLAVVFRPAAAAPVVARVTFTGSEAVPRSALENAINAVAVGTPYKEAQFRRLLETSVRPLYDARGRVRAAFPEIRAEPEKDVKGLLLTVKVEEGGSYSLGQVHVDTDGKPAPELVKSAEFKSGDVFNVDKVQEGIGRLEKRLRAGGYMHVAAKFDRRIDDKAKTVDVDIHLARGPQYVFGKLNIQGLDLISEPAVRKMWGLKEGQPYNADYPDYFLARIREDGVFDNLGDTKAVAEPDDDAHTVDVTLVFKGSPPQPRKKREW